MKKITSKKLIFSMVAFSLLCATSYANATSIGYIKVQNLYITTPSCAWYGGSQQSSDIVIDQGDSNIRSEKFTTIKIENTNTSSNYIGYGVIKYGLDSPCQSYNRVSDCTIYFGLDTNGHLIPNVTAQGTQQSGCTNGIVSSVSVQNASNFIFSIGY